MRAGPPTIPSRPSRLTLDDPISGRLNDWTRHAQLLSNEGLPIPVSQVNELIEHLRARGEYLRAEHALTRAEGLLTRAEKDWTLLRELLNRIDELKGLADRAGIDLGEFDRRLDDPRKVLQTGRLSEGLLEKAMAAGTRSLTVLNDVMLKYFVTESRFLGRSIRAGRDRGEDVDEATGRMRSFVHALRSGQLRGTAVAYLDLRRSVAAIPREPMVALSPEDEEQEILKEARNLARRLHRLKGSARDATTAVRLMSQVRAALSEDRRYTAPTEEIEQLWTEVDRLTQERLDARPGATSVPVSPTVTRVRTAPPASRPAPEPVEESPHFLEELDDAGDPPAQPRRLRRSRSPPPESL
jgi:hypothetical protein